MEIIVLKGSPLQNGTVASLLKSVTEPLSAEHDLEMIEVCKFNMKHCTACMVCREKKICILSEDYAHIMAKKIKGADTLVIREGK